MDSQSSREYKRGQGQGDNAFFAVPQVPRRSSLSLQSRTEEGNRKRKAQVQVGEGSIKEFFTKVATACQERKQRLTRCTQVSSHDTLCSVLLSNDIQPAQPLQRIYAQTAKIAHNEPAIQEFRRQWENYVRYVHAANVKEKQQRAPIDSEWFDKHLGRITFVTVFSCYLWSRTSEQQEEFDMFASGSVAESKRRPDELLKPEDILDSEAPRDALTVILSHLENREVRAKGKVLSAAFRDWFVKHKGDIVESLPERLNMDNPPMLFQPIAARTALNGLVTDQREKWAKLYEEEGDAVSARAQAWEKEASELLEQKRAAYMSDLERVKSLMSVHIRLSAYAHWTNRVLQAVVRCKAGLAKCRDDDTVFQHIRSHWPTPCQERQAKRLKLFMPAPHEDEKAEHKQQQQAAGDNLSTQVNAVLDAGFTRVESETDDELAALSDVLDQLREVLAAHLKLKASKEPLEERKLLCESAVVMDFAEFGKVVAERAANQAQVIVQSNIQPAHTHILALEKFEEDLIKTTLEAKEAFRTSYAAVYDKIRRCVAEQVWARLRKRGDKLREFDEKQRGTVVLYEPWLDRTLLTPDQQRELKDLLPDLQTVPQTISAALIQSSAWLEQLYATECGV